MVFHKFTPPGRFDLHSIVRTGREECHHLFPAFSLLISAPSWLSAREPTDARERDNHRRTPPSCLPVNFCGNNPRRAQPPPATLSEKPSASSAAVMCLRMKDSGDMSHLGRMLPTASHCRRQDFLLGIEPLRRLCNRSRQECFASKITARKCVLNLPLVNLPQGPPRNLRNLP